MSESTDRKRIEVHTDGGCLPNPGAGGYAAVLTCGTYRKELSGGYRRTTNNRMEMMAAIVALEALRAPSIVTIFTDSQVLISYLTDRGQSIARTLGEAGLRLKTNGDLRVRLWRAIGEHKVTVLKVIAHSGVPENERCDVLATQARCNTAVMLVDEVYERKGQQATLAFGVAGDDED